MFVFQYYVLYAMNRAQNQCQQITCLIHDSRRAPMILSFYIEFLSFWIEFLSFFAFESLLFRNVAELIVSFALLER